MTTNNTGLAITSQHSVSREAQQQRTQARPGPHQLQYVSMASTDSDNFLISPHATPQTQRFDAACFDGIPVAFPYGAHWNMMLQKNQENFANNMAAESKNFDPYSNDSALSTPNFDGPTGQAWPAGDVASRRNSKRISDGIMDRVSKFESMSMDDFQRPTTPPSQNGNDRFPPTPLDTPHDRTGKQGTRPERFSDEFDESMEETIRPNRKNRSAQNAQSAFAEMRRQTEGWAPVPSPPETSTIPNCKTFNSLQMQDADFMNMKALRNEFAELEDPPDVLKYESDVGQSASDFSRRPSPEPQNVGRLDGAAFEGGRDFRPSLKSASSASSRTGSLHRRTDSVASIASAASIADINIDEARTDTGVTLEEISQYILGPEATDGKWTCLFEECGKKFGRKENIKSHVQTHLNDRQYQCPTCLKCFVRQHDLKRHAKIHTGVKPYPCECGNSFARHDALTRHRQRGMCIGAFDGVVRKVVKRGRPRKNRPDMETRTDKSARTRRKNMSISSLSSFSGYSDSSAVNSPDNGFDLMDDMMDLEVASSSITRGMGSMSTAPMPTLTPRDMKHHHVTPSPSVVSVQSFVAPEAMTDSQPPQSATPARSVASHYNTPPELSQSSSPPPGQFFDLEASSATGANDLAVIASTGGLMGSSDLSGTLTIALGDQDDLLLQFGQHDGLVHLDRDPSMLLMNKFDDDFEDTVSMFTNSDDMFFGCT